MGDAVVEVVQGRLRGDSVAGGAVVRFRGIPYAGAVSGAARFQPAPPPVAWSGVRDCLDFGPAAPQPALELGEGERAKALQVIFDEIGSFERRGEDCLVLNVWAPAAMPGSPRPVMVWIHGGGHTVGSGALSVYDGSWLAEHEDVVVVTINHRLGVLGYLYLGELLGEEFVSSANIGNLDIVTALRWVRDNVAAFGGDPGNVTIFGESGGGAKVSALLAMPDAAGLFHRAIIQSGPKLTALSTEYACETALRLLAELGLGPGDARRLFDVPVDELIPAQFRALGGALGSATVGGRALGPMVDGRVLPCHPFDPVAPGVSASVPVLIGTNKDEMTLFTYPNEALDQLDDAGASAAFVASHGDAGAALCATYATTRPSLTPAQRVNRMMTDRFRVGSIRLAERKAAQGVAPVWMYRFDYESDVLAGALGAPHAMEVAYVFGIPDAVQLSGRRPERHDVARRMSAAFASFARTGSPRSGLLPEWPPYDCDTRMTMLFDADCTLVSDPDAAERRAWDGLVAGI